MSKRIAILHFASPPTIGGVESIMAYHARGLVDQGYRVRVISGDGAPFDPQVEMVIEPAFGSKHPDVLHVKKQLDAGIVSESFEALVSRLHGCLIEALDGCDVCIVHNVHSLHKNLALTAALHRLTLDTHYPVRWIAWAHDLAWTNPQYQSELHNGLPWDLLRQRWPHVRYVTISEARREEMAGLFGDAEAIPIITAGVDLPRFLRWTPTTARIVQTLGLLEAEGLLLLPARLTRRKNIAFALAVLAEMRQQSGQDFRLLITGPPGPHNPSNLAYYEALRQQRHQYQLDHAAHFLYELGDTNGTPLILDDDTVADLFRLSDALFFPSLQEGFGIPILEAGLTRLPIYCSDIAPFKQIGGSDVVYFDPRGEDAARAAATVAKQILEDFVADAAYRLRRRVRYSYRWEVIIESQLIPLLEEV